MTSPDDDATSVANDRAGASTGFVPPLESCIVDGRTVAYATYGDPDGVPVVAFHGLPGSRAFGALLADSARDHGVRLVVPDRPGVGGSDPIGEHGVDGRASDGRAVADTATEFEGFLDALELDAAGVLGFSAGGPHALAARALATERTYGAALLASPAPPDAAVPEPVSMRVLGALARNTRLGLSLACRIQAMLLSRADADALVDLFTTAPVVDDPIPVETVGADAVGADAVGADAVGADAVGADAESTATHPTIGDVLVADADLTLERGHRALVDEYRTLNEDWGFDPYAIGASVDVFHGRDDANVDPAAADHYERVLADATVHRPSRDHLELVIERAADALDAAAGR